MGADNISKRLKPRKSLQYFLTVSSYLMVAQRRYEKHLLNVYKHPEKHSGLTIDSKS